MDQRKLTQEEYEALSKKIQDIDLSFGEVAPEEEGVVIIERELLFTHQNIIGEQARLDQLLDQVEGKRKWIKAQKQKEHNLICNIEKLRGE